MNDNRIYEVGYLVLPTLPEDKVAAAVGDLKAALEKSNAVVISDENPRVTRLAYSIEKVIDNKKNKFDTAYFGWVKFEAPAEAAQDLKGSLDRNEKFVRFMIIKTVRENTMAPKKVFRPEGARRPSTKDEGAEAVEMDKEAVDKKIEELTTA